MRLMHVIFLTLMLGLSTYSHASDKVEITLLATSDLHGVFIPWDYASDSANLSGSLSQIATKIKDIRANNPNVILIDTGDLIQGNFIETFNDNELSPMILGLNALQYDIWVMGNHEFDFGQDLLNRTIQQFSGTVVTANIYHSNDSHFLAPYKIMEKDGVKIAIIGVTTPMVVEFAEGSDRLKGLVFTNPAQEVTKIIAEINDSVDAIILVSHMGLDNENEVADTGNTDIANQNQQLVAIFAGHMHVNLNKVMVNEVIITEPGKYGQQLARVDLQFEKVGDRYQLVHKDSYTYDINGMESDKELEAIFAPYHAILRANANQPIAVLTGENLVPSTIVKGIPQVQIQDTGISALYHEASLYYAPLANVVALQIDNDTAQLDVGDIRMKDIAYNYTYKGGEITVYAMTGADLKSYMEWAVDYFNQVQDGDVTYSFNPARRASKYSTNDFFGNVNYVVNLSKPTGQRIEQLTFADGSAITDETPIRLGLNAYRMAHLTQKGGALEGKTFAILFDSKQAYGDDEGTIRNMTVRYLQDVKQGTYEGKQMQRWYLTGLQGHPQEKVIVESLLNNGLISVPMSDDGRFSNVASINVKDKLFTTKESYNAELMRLQTQLTQATDPIAQKRIQDNITLIKALNSF